MKKKFKNAVPFGVALLLSLFSLPCLAQWTMVNDLPVPVGEIDTGVLDGKIYVFGGKIDGLYSSDTVWVFDPETGWFSGGKMPDSLEDVVVEEYNGKFYLFGGHSHPDFVYRKTVMVYDPATSSFDTVGEMPGKRAFFTSVVLGGKIYLIGGDDGVIGATNTVDIFDPLTGIWTPGFPMATKRAVPAADILNGKIYVIGGGSGTTAFNTMEIYDPATGWTTSPATMHYPRGFFACKTVDGKIFALGGTVSATEPIQNRVEYFDPQLEEWVDFEPMIYARRKLGAAVLGGHVLYAIGGGGDAGYMTKVEKYDLNEQGNWVFKAALPTPRAYCTSSVVNDKIYVIGGAYSKTETSAVVDKFDPATNTWENMASFPVPILGASAQTIAGKIYVAGGQNQYLVTSKNTLYVYDPALGDWTQKASMPTARGYLSTAVVDDKLYAIGGTTVFPTRVNTVEMYDPVINAWVEKAPMPTARSGFSCEVIDGKIYAMGGVAEGGYFDVLEVYDPVTNTWATKEEMPQTRVIFSSGVVDDIIYSYGGVSNNDEFLENIIRYHPQTDNWEPVDTMPEYKAAFASSVVDGCIYGIGGALYPFFLGTPGAKVSGTVLQYCPVISSVAPGEMPLVQLKNYPNPFHSTTRILFTLSKRSKTSLDIIDINGRKVATLVNGVLNSGQYEAVWDGSGSPAGVYFYRLRTEEFMATGKCVLIQNY
mgnify:CR=1 FL=1